MQFAGMSQARSFVTLAAVAAIWIMSPQASEAQARPTGLRLAWNQDVADSTPIASHLYTIYIDGTPSPFEGWSCSPTSGSTSYDCVAWLPDLTSGTHTVELATSVVIAGKLLKSGRSLPVHVSIPPLPPAGGIETTGARRGQAEQIVTSDDLRLVVETVASGLNNPTDLAVAPDGVLFVAERGGTIRVVHDGGLPDASLTLEGVSTGHPAASLLSIALDPQFDRNGLVYVAYATPASSGALAYQLARFRYVGGSFGERAVLVDGIPGTGGSLAASLRFGPDGKLYAAFGDTSEELRNDASSFNGKLLRFNPDGTTPSDQPAASPVYVSGLRAPRGLAWDPDGTLWIIDDAQEGTTQIRSLTSGMPPRAMATHLLPSHLAVGSIVRYDHPLIPSFRGNLLMGAVNSGQIVRVRFDLDSAGDRRFTTERLLQDQVGSVRMVAVSPRGEIYFCTANTLGRLVPN